MTNVTQRRAEATLDELRNVTSLVLPEPQAEVVALAQADAPVADEIRRRMDEIDLTDTPRSCISGRGRRRGCRKSASRCWPTSRTRTWARRAKACATSTTIRGFSVNELDVRRERSWWEKLTGRAAPFAKFVANYEEVQGQIDRITVDLDAHQHQLLKDIKSLDVLYERTLDFYDELALYIAAGEAKLRELDEKDIPAKEAEVAASKADGDVMEAQELRDLRAMRDDLERRVHDLRLTRQVTMQSLPSIRLVQENDKSLVTKISSTLVNTVPLWETQLCLLYTSDAADE